MQQTRTPSRRSALGLIGSVLFCPGAGHAEGLASISGTAFGTHWRCVAPQGAGIERLRSQFEALFRNVDRQMSPWRPDSTVSRFNASAAGWHKAEPGVVDVTKRALVIAALSRGRFDPTVGPLVARWGFGLIEGNLDSDWRGLSVAPGRIAKAYGGLTLDLCGIAKGWALDRAIELARDAGHDALLFDLGGELRALGHHPSGRPWHAAVEHPVSGEPAPALLDLWPGMAVATSGQHNQGYKLGNRTYGHIIDPAAGRPASSKLLSVTVLASDATDADGWATALFAAGAAGPSLAREHRIAALFLMGDIGRVHRITSGGMRDALI